MKPEDFWKKPENAKPKPDPKPKPSPKK